MRRTLIAATLLLTCFRLTAQDSHTSSLELLVQTRALHQFNKGGEASFRIKSDWGLGIRWVANLSSQLQLVIGGHVNHGSYEKQNFDRNDLYYIDFFKSESYQYFNLIDLSQWTAEIPLSIRRSFFHQGNSTIGCYLSGSPQFLMYSRIHGFGFEGEEELYHSITSSNTPSNYYPSERRFLTDVYVSSGVFFTREILNKRSLFVETGYEYSTLGKSSGVVIKMGFGF